MSTPISEMPCPFCGSTYAQKIEAKFGKPPHVHTGYRLQCCLCDAQTGIGMTDEIIKGWWERRAPSSAIAPPEPTEEMCAVGAQKLYEIENHKPYGVRLERVYIARDIYKAMVAARG